MYDGVCTGEVEPCSACLERQKEHGFVASVKAIDQAHAFFGGGIAVEVVIGDALGL